MLAVVALVRAPARRVRPLSPSTVVGPRPVHPRHQRVEQHHDPGHAGPPARDGDRSAAADPGRRPRRRGLHLLDPRRRPRVRPVHGHRRLAPAARRAVRAVPRLRRRCCSRSARSCPRSTSPAARSSTRPSRSRRTATCSRSRASSLAVALARRATRGLGRDVGGAGVRRRRGRVRRARRGRRRERGPPELGRQAPGHAGRGDGARRRGRAGDRPGHVDRRLRATATGPAARAWCSSTTRSTRSSRSRARTASAGSSSSPRTASRPCATILVDHQRPSWVGPPILERDDVARVPGLPRRRRPALRDRAREHGPMTPRARRGSRRSRVFAVALAVRVVAASIIDFPQARGHGLLRRRRAQPRRGPRASCSDALWSYGTPPLVFPRPAFEVWLPLPSLLAAIPMALAGGPAPDPARDGDARGARSCPVVAGAIVAVLAWRLAADVAAGARPAGRPGANARGRDRAHRGRLPAAAAPLRAARLHDAVRRPRPRRGAADDARPARPARRPAARRPPPRDRPAHRRSRR